MAMNELDEQPVAEEGSDQRLGMLEWLVIAICAALLVTLLVFLVLPAVRPAITEMFYYGPDNL